MTVTVSPYAVWGVLSLALFGVVFLWRVARNAARDLWAWLRRDRVSPLLEDDDGGISDDCALGDHFACEGCWCTCGHDIELPPERSWEDMTAEAGGAGSSPAWVPGRKPVFPGVSVDSTPSRPSATFLERLEARRERLASAAELEHRAAYEAMGLEFPSGLMARMREAGQ